MLAKLSETLFIDTLRRYVAGLPEHQKGWLAGDARPNRGKEPGLNAQPDRTSMDNCRSCRSSRHFAICPGGALYAISFGASHSVFNALQTGIGSAFAGRDFTGRSGNRCQCRVRIGSCIQSRIQEGVWTSSPDDIATIVELPSPDAL